VHAANTVCVQRQGGSPARHQAVSWPCNTSVSMCSYVRIRRRMCFVFCACVYSHMCPASLIPVIPVFHNAFILEEHPNCVRAFMHHQLDLCILDVLIGLCFSCPKQGKCMYVYNTLQTSVTGVVWCAWHLCKRARAYVCAPIRTCLLQCLRIHTHVFAQV